MAVLKKLTNYLEDNNITHEIVEHKTVYTALDKAATLDLRPQAVVKTLVIKIARGEYVFALLPAHRNLDKQKFKKALNKWRKKQDLPAARQASLATERWMRKNITGSVGATLPFGHLYGYPTVVDAPLMRQRDVYINTGDYTYSVRLTKSRWAKALGVEDDDKNVIKAAISKAKK